MIVDASAWLEIVAGRVAPTVLAGEELAAPEHFDAEVLSGLRGLVRGGHLRADDGADWWDATISAPIERIALRTLTDLWRLSDAVSAYDAPYVAAAARERTLLLTADRRLAQGAAGHCEIRHLRV